MSTGGVSPLHVIVLLSNIPIALVVSLNITSPIYVSSSTRIISPLVPKSINTSPSSMIVTGIPNVPFTSSTLFQKFQSNPSGSTSFVQGYPWYGGHIPPSS